MPASTLSPNHQHSGAHPGRFYSIQLALASGSVPAASGALVRAGFPDGMMFNESMSRISGTRSREPEGNAGPNPSRPSAPVKLDFGIGHFHVRDRFFSKQPNVGEDRLEESRWPFMGRFPVG